jgi:hypothetical protein
LPVHRYILARLCCGTGLRLKGALIFVGIYCGLEIGAVQAGGNKRSWVFLGVWACSESALHENLYSVIGEVPCNGTDKIFLRKATSDLPCSLIPSGSHLAESSGPEHQRSFEVAKHHSLLAAHPWYWGIADLGRTAGRFVGPTSSLYGTSCVGRRCGWSPCTVNTTVSIQ